MKNKSQQQQHTEHTINLMELNSRRLIFSITISSETLDFVFIFFLAFAIDCTYAQTYVETCKSRSDWLRWHNEMLTFVISFCFQWFNAFHFNQMKLNEKIHSEGSADKN